LKKKQGAWDSRILENLPGGREEAQRKKRDMRVFRNFYPEEA
jgi:hypothetical protein